MEKFEQILGSLGKKIDEAVKDAPSFFKENIEKPLNEAFDSLKEVISDNLGATMVFVEIKGFSLDQIKVDLEENMVVVTAEKIEDENKVTFSKVVETFYDLKKKKITGLTLKDNILCVTIS